MAAVPQKTLNWLYGVLGRDYRDQNRAYNDIAQTISQFPSLAPKTDVYTYEHGAPALLLQLAGTIPVAFRTETYRFPITIWIPHAYPLEAPMVYVIPTEDMLIRPGQHVGGEGKVYHYYLAHWRDSWDRASIVEFVRILSSIFAKEPPVMAKLQNMNRQPPPQASRPAPQIPPVPPSMQQPPSAQRVYEPGPTPPPPPPKQLADDHFSLRSPENRPRSRYDAPPPLPPEASSNPRSPPANGSASRFPGSQDYLPQRQSSLSHSMLAQGASPQQYQQDWRPQTQARMSQPPVMPPQQYISQQGQSQIPQYSQAPLPQPQAQQHSGPTYQDKQGLFAGNQQYILQQPRGTIPVQSQRVSKPQPPPDLLDSPFDISLPVFTNLPAPPVPPNPEKDALLSTLSSALTQNLHQSILQNQSALPSLQAQHAAMMNTYAQLQRELANTNNLSSTLSSNNAILASSLQKADTAISASRQRATAGDIPKVDEMVTAPTIVGRQLYDVVCEERGVEAAIWALQEGFVRGRIGSDVWSKKSRDLAREGFRKRYLARKIGRGMGLDMSLVEGR